MKKVCVICVKLVTGDYFGADQDLSLSNVILRQAAAAALVEAPTSRYFFQKPFQGSSLSGTFSIVNLLGSRPSSSSHVMGVETVAVGVALRL